MVAIIHEAMGHECWSRVVVGPPWLFRPWPGAGRQSGRMVLLPLILLPLVLVQVGWGGRTRRLQPQIYGHCTLGEDLRKYIFEYTFFNYQKI